MSFIDLVKSCIKPLKGQCFFSASEVQADSKEVVVLIHGLIRRGSCFKALARKIAKTNLPCYVYDYDTTLKHIAGHGIDFKEFLVNKVYKDYPNAKVNIVSHSLGGIVSRYAINALTEIELQRINKVIMLGPPNQGSDIASLVCKLLPWAKKIILPLEELCSGDDSTIKQVPVLKDFDIDLAIISGKYDWLVKKEYTFLENISYSKHVNSDHSFMMYNPIVQKEVINYLHQK
ncbi:alpha/beta hydrolase [Lentisphaerota bacterium WC36G]|nr:alpha/beta hydrolase [Lentisphaerae bacterium WC36]